MDSGREGIGGWLNPTRYGWERVSYWLQRLTGLGLLIYFIGHVYETSSLTNGIRCMEQHVGINSNSWRSHLSAVCYRRKSFFIPLMEYALFLQSLGRVWENPEDRIIHTRRRP